VKLPAPIVTTTPTRSLRRGAQALGASLIERFAFDFPGTARTDPQLGPKRLLFSPLTLSEGSRPRQLLLPQAARSPPSVGTRAANTATELEWPLPDVPKAAPAPFRVPAAAKP
jgi:hypothetical protein